MAADATTVRPQLPEDLEFALSRAAEDPSRDQRWDDAESIAANHDMPEAVFAAYERALATELGADALSHLGQRAVRFHDEWFEDPAPLLPVLSRVLSVDPDAAWAFERATMLLTVKERWAELLSLYDEVIQKTSDAHRRRSLLGEAAQVAKDFARDPDRAIGYLMRSFEERKNDDKLVASLERLLESRARWADLVSLWTSLLAGMAADARAQTLLRLATTKLAKLGDPDGAAESALAFEKEKGATPEVLELFESVGGDARAKDETRRAVLERARAAHRAADRHEALAKVLERLGGLALGADVVAVKRELGGVLVSLGKSGDALRVLAAALAVDPSDEATDAEVEKVAATEGRLALAEALFAAEGHAESPDAKVALLVRSGRAFAEADEGARAAAAFRSAFELSSAGIDARRSAGEDWTRVLREGGHRDELAAALGAVAEILAPDARKRALGERAALCLSLGDTPGAIAAWKRRIADDAADREALDASVGLLADDPAALVEVLVLRAPLLEGEAQRADRERIADLRRATGEIELAIAERRAIEKDLGATAGNTDALADLLADAGHADELEQHLEAAVLAESDKTRLPMLLGRLSWVQCDATKKPTEALGNAEAALAEDPREPSARRTLAALMDVGDVARRAMTVLVAALTATKDHGEKLALLDRRLALAVDDAERATLVGEAAELAETEVGDPRTALGYACKALTLSPDDPRLFDLVERLEGKVDAKGDVAMALIDAARAATAERKLLLAIEAARRFEDIGMFADARAAFAIALSASPDSLTAAVGAVRLSVRQRAHADAARSVLDAVLAGGFTEAVLTTAEGELVDGAHAAELASALLGLVRRSEVPAGHARDLFFRAGIWLRDRVSDAELAIGALEDALRAVPTDVETLGALVALRGEGGGRPLVENLVALSRATDDLAPLSRAALLAERDLDDAGLAQSLYRELRDRASERADQGALLEAVDGLERVSVATPALGAIEASKELEWGARRSELPDEVRVFLFRRAAERAEEGEDPARAIELYAALGTIAAADDEAVEARVRLLGVLGRHAEQVELRRGQLERATDVERRVALRLDVARILGVVGDGPGRVGALEQNLVERPGEPETMRLLDEALVAAGRHDELARVLREQGKAVGGASGAELLVRAAAVVEGHLSDKDLAATILEEAVALSPTPGALDAAARLHLDRGRPEAAARHLEARLAATRGAERADVVLRLSAALLLLGHHERAREVLEGALQDAPLDRDLAARLADVYRRTSAWEPLARLLAEDASHVDVPEVRLAVLRELADVRRHRLGQAAEAADVLQEALALAPDDKLLRTSLADALRAAGRLDEARAMLQGLVEEYGRRRPQERASLHLALAHVARDRGDTQEALSQLDLAASMDMGHTGVFHLLGRVAEESGQLERAERAYRALLLAVRRQKPEALDGAASVGQAETLAALARVAKARDDAAQASELVETAFDTAAQDPRECDRLLVVLRQAGDEALVLRALKLRVDQAKEPRQRAVLRAELADAIEATDAAGALDLRLAAARDGGADPTFLARARAAAKAAGKSGALADALVEGGTSQRRPELTSLAAEIQALDAGDLAKAEATYERLAAEGHAALALRGKATLARSRGDGPAESDALRQLLEQGEVADGGVSWLRVAELDLARESSADGGREALSRAIDAGVDPKIASSMLAALVRSTPSAAVAAEFERIARRADDPSMLLDALERLADVPGATDAQADVLREAAELAQSLGETARAKAAWTKLVEAAPDVELQLVALLALTEAAKAEGATRDAIAWLARAAKVASDEDASKFDRERGMLSALDGDVDGAVAAYESALARDPADRNAWSPLLEILRKAGRKTDVSRVIERTTEAVYDPSDRRALRAERAKLLIDDGEDERAEAVLRDMLGDDPDDADAAEILAGILERSGRRDDLVDLLSSQLDGARGRRDAPTIARLSIRLSGLQASDDDRRNLLRDSLETAPEEPGLLRAYFALIQADPAADRAEILDRLVAVESVDLVPALADRAAATWEEASDPDRAEQSLARAFARVPQDAGLADAYVERLRARGELDRLCDVLIARGEAATSVETAVASLSEAASLAQGSLGDPERAISALKKARARAPEDGGILSELVQVLDGSGDVEGALATVSEVVDTSPPDWRSGPLRLRAWLHVRHGEPASAVNDLEEALRLGDEGARQELVDALSDLQARASGAGERDPFRAATLRLAQLLKDDPEGRAEGVLYTWLEVAPDDLEALLLLETLGRARGAMDTVFYATRARMPLVVEGDLGALAKTMLDAGKAAGLAAEAKEVLEAAFERSGRAEAIRILLADLYDAIGAHRDRANLLAVEAAATADPKAKRELLLRAGETLVAKAGDAEGAIPVLEEALSLKPGDHETTVLLADAYVGSGRLDKATELIDAAVAGHKNRRSKELGALQHRMARIAVAAGDKDVELAWLNVALDCDMQNGAIATELALAAMELEQWEPAQKALRAITMMKTPGPMTKAEAYLRQAMIARVQGDQKKAVLLGKRALQEDATLESAKAFLAEIGA